MITFFGKEKKHSSYSLSKSSVFKSRKNAYFPIQYVAETPPFHTRTDEIDWKGRKLYWWSWRSNKLHVFSNKYIVDVNLNATIENGIIIRRLMIASIPLGPKTVVNRYLCSTYSLLFVAVKIKHAWPISL